MMLIRSKSVEFQNEKFQLVKQEFPLITPRSRWNWLKGEKIFWMKIYLLNSVENCVSLLWLPSLLVGCIDGNVYYQSESSSSKRRRRLCYEQTKKKQGQKVGKVFEYFLLVRQTRLWALLVCFDFTKDLWKTQKNWWWERTRIIGINSWHVTWTYHEKVCRFGATKNKDFLRKSFPSCERCERGGKRYFQHIFFLVDSVVGSTFVEFSVLFHPFFIVFPSHSLFQLFLVSFNNENSIKLSFIQAISFRFHFSSFDKRRRCYHNRRKSFREISFLLRSDPEIKKWGIRYISEEQTL